MSFRNYHKYNGLEVGSLVLVGESYRTQRAHILLREARYEVVLGCARPAPSSNPLRTATRAFSPLKRRTWRPQSHPGLFRILIEKKERPLSTHSLSIILLLFRDVCSVLRYIFFVVCVHTLTHVVFFSKGGSNC